MNKNSAFLLMNETLKFYIPSLIFFESNSSFTLWDKTSNSIFLIKFSAATLWIFLLREFGNPLLCKHFSSTLENSISEKLIFYFQSILLHMNPQVQLTKENPNQLIEIKPLFQLVSKIRVLIKRNTEKTLVASIPSTEIENQALMITGPNDYRETVSLQSSLSDLSQKTTAVHEIKNSSHASIASLKKMEIREVCRGAPSTVTNDSTFPQKKINFWTWFF